ncbi:MAG: hypothetical protein HQ515_05110 [Phycisphaeraceae bacterium]|nr:hypothetical protein [Phycisphaeraceae bacterium]
MDNYDLANFDEDNQQVPPPAADLNKPIPFDDSDPPATATPVSRKPLTLGANGSARPQAAPRPQAPAKPAPRPAAAQATAVSKKVGQVVAKNTSRITGLKTFYTKLHPGALDFIDEQVAEWLKAHPSIYIKQVNVTVGEVQSKKTEPNIIISVWY